MTPEAQRIAIAEACGWTNIDRYLGRAPIPFTREFLGGVDDGLAEGEDTLGHKIKPLPDYLADLNAMHEAEKMLTREQRDDYASELYTMLPCDENNGPIDMDDPDAGDVMTPSMFQVSHATAAQRAEAFLRTIGKWEENT